MFWIISCLDRNVPANVYVSMTMSRLQQQLIVSRCHKQIYHQSLSMMGSWLTLAVFNWVPFCAIYVYICAIYFVSCHAIF